MAVYNYNPKEVSCDFSRNANGTKKFVMSLSTGAMPTAPAFYEGLSEEEQGKTKPLDILAPWSRVLFYLDDTPIGAGTRRAFFKLSVADFRLLLKRVEHRLESHSSTPTVTAFPEKVFPSGKFKGKTAKQVLSEGIGTADELLKNAAWLAANHGGDVAKIALMNAILSALQISPAQVETATTVQAETLAEGKCRSTTEKDTNGKIKFYDYCVSFDASRRYNITIMAKNYFAPLLERPDGTQGPDTSKAEGQVVNQFYLTVDEFYKILDQVNLIIEGAYCDVAPKALACAAVLEKNKRDSRA